MVDITIDGDKAVFEVEGIDKMWSLRSRLQIPLAHIKSVRADPTVAHGWWHGLRLGGTNVPGILTAGTFYHHGNKVFWDVHNPENTIVLELDHEFYNQLIIEVSDAANAVTLLQNRIGSARE